MSCELTNLQIIHRQWAVNCFARCTITRARSTFIFACRRAEHQITSHGLRSEVLVNSTDTTSQFVENDFDTHLTLTIHAHIICFIITCRSIDHLWLVTIIKSFASWHTIQFTWIRCFGVWHPFIVNTFEWYFIEMGTLLGSKIVIGIRTILYSLNETINVNFCVKLDAWRKMHSKLPECCTKSI